METCLADKVATGSTTHRRGIGRDWTIQTGFAAPTSHGISHTGLATGMLIHWTTAHCSGHIAGTTSWAFGIEFATRAAFFTSRVATKPRSAHASGHAVIGQGTTHAIGADLSTGATVSTSATIVFIA